MRRCKQCASEFPDATKVCPTCGNDVLKLSNYEQLKLDRKTKLNLAIIAFSLIVIIATLIGSFSDNSKAVNSETAKATAILMDKQIFDIITSSEKTTEILQDGINLVAEGQGTLLDLYDLTKKAKDNQFAFSSSLMKLNDKSNKDYIDACQEYVINAQLIAENLLKYIDSQDLKYLSEARQRLESRTNYISQVIAERMIYLSSLGLTGEEVSEALSPTDKDK